MSYKEQTKNLIVASLASSPQKTVVNDLKTKIVDAINSGNLPITVEQPYPEEWDTIDTNKLEMLIKNDIGVSCYLQNSKVICPLINFFQ